jgi:hypothetical protein
MDSMEIEFQVKLVASPPSLPPIMDALQAHRWRVGAGHIQVLASDWSSFNRRVSLY